MKLTKAKLAARKREEAKRKAKESLLQPKQELNPVTLEMQVEVDPTHPEEVKQEPQWETLKDVLNEEVKVEPLESTEEGPDPIGGQQSTVPVIPLQPKLEYETDRCQFCLSSFDEVGGRAFVNRRKVVFVLGLRRGRIRQQNPECCQCCKLLFDQSFGFKKSCLAALAISEEVLASGERKDEYEIVDLKAAFGIPLKMAADRSGESGMDEMRKAGASSLAGEVSSMECSICKEKFFEWSKLEQHWVSHYSVPAQEPTTDPGSVPEDQQGKEQKSVELYCFRCRTWFPTEPVFTQHKPLCTEAQEPVPQNKPVKGSGDFYCYRCRKWFQTESIFANHKPSCIEATKEKYPTEAIQINSGLLSMQFDSDANSTSTQPAPEDQSKKSKLYCRRCRKRFQTELLFTHHKALCKKSHEKKPVFACPQCPKKCSSEKYLTLHINKHNGIRTIPCRREGCSKLFLDATVRNNHEMACGKDVPVTICSVCGATFRWLASLQTHMKIHEEPKFSCDVCDKKFHSNSRLKKHSAVHSDARNYECKVCGKRFKSHEANRVHQRIHTQEKPYVCHICGMAFTYNCLLKTHLEKGHDSQNSGRKELPVRPVATSSFQFPPSMWPTDGGY